MENSSEEKPEGTNEEVKMTEEKAQDGVRGDLFFTW